VISGFRSAPMCQFNLVLVLLSFIVLPTVGCSFITGSCNAQGGKDTVSCGGSAGPTSAGPTSAVQCHASYPLVLQIPPETGAHVGVTVEALCAVPAGRTYLVIEKLPDVDPANPHPVYFVKATIPYLRIGQTSSKDFVLNEPIGTRAEFWVISVDNGGWRALNQNKVVDNGVLYLPSGTIRESVITWHTKGWQ
jgi:hypothetical protein